VNNLFYKEKSNGAIDDGTGIALLLELAKYLSQIELRETRVVLGFFGAEELGMLGSIDHYFNQTIYNNKKLDLVVSMDMIGEEPPLSVVKQVGLVNGIKMEQEFIGILKSLGRILNIDIEGTKKLYPSSDYAAFRLIGNIPTCQISNASKYYHTKHDIRENINYELLQDALRLMLGYLVYLKENEAIIKKKQ
jgi:putative aminopeptidase FrvX